MDKVYIRAEVVPINQIRIRHYYRKSEPSQAKIDRCLSFFFDNGYFEDEITLDRFGYLKDGYIKYLFLMYSSVEKARVLHVFIKEAIKPITPPEPIKRTFWLYTGTKHKKPTFWQRVFVHA